MEVNKNNSNKEFCSCGERFNKYTWKCIPIKMDVFDNNDWERIGVPNNVFLYICPKCNTVKGIY